MWGGHSMERAVSPEGLVLVSQRSMQQIFVICVSVPSTATESKGLPSPWAEFRLFGGGVRLG